MIRRIDCGKTQDYCYETRQLRDRMEDIYKKLNPYE